MRRAWVSSLSHHSVVAPTMGLHTQMMVAADEHHDDAPVHFRILVGSQLVEIRPIDLIAYYHARVTLRPCKHRGDSPLHEG